MKNIILLAAAGLAAIHFGAASPPTLLELGGARHPEAHLSESVILIIDAQREYTAGKLPLSGVDAALRQTQRLLQRGRQTGVPIIHIQQRNKPGRSLFDPDGLMVAFAPEAMPLADEIVISKTLPNAFAGTTLDAALKKLARKKSSFPAT